MRIIVAAGVESIDTRSTATLDGRGHYTKSGRVDLARARAACATSVAEELAATRIVPFLRSQPPGGCTA